MKKTFNPWFYFSLTFIVLIFIGTILLYFHTHLSIIDSIFTSTSAVCVTGLIVTDTAKLDITSQIIILSLIQLGGLGVMVLTSSILLFVKGFLDLKTKILIQKVGDYFSLYDIEKILKVVILYTFSIELIGAIILTIGFKIEGYSIINSIYYGIFHSISAFCNAGFSTFTNSLIGHNIIIKITVILLIILGGLGFFVIYDLLYEKEKITVHTKIVLTTTTFLILIAFLLIYLLNIKNISIIDALFQAVTPRTAGFNTVDLNSLSIETIFILIILMVIGASPGSTGGGIKTTTFFLIFTACFKVIKGQDRVVVYKRKIENFIILKAFSLFFLYTSIITLATSLLMNTNQHNLLKCFFEVTSAIGTVGLSLGITSDLDFWGKLIIIFCMFLGRIGPASFVLMLTLKEKKSYIDYPEEKVIIG